MWDLNTIVRMNDEAQRRADAIREYEARHRQTNDRVRVPAVPIATARLSCRVSEPHSRS